MQAKVDAFESHSSSIRQLRQDRLESDARADAAESRAEDLRVELNSAQNKLKQALRKCVSVGLFRTHDPSTNQTLTNPNLVLTG